MGGEIQFGFVDFIYGHLVQQTQFGAIPSDYFKFNVPSDLFSTKKQIKIKPIAILIQFFSLKLKRLGLKAYLSLP